MLEINWLHLFIQKTEERAHSFSQNEERRGGRGEEEERRRRGAAFAVTMDEHLKRGSTSSGAISGYILERKELFAILSCEVTRDLLRAESKCWVSMRDMYHIHWACSYSSVGFHLGLLLKIG